MQSLQQKLRQQFFLKKKLQEIYREQILGMSPHYWSPHFFPNPLYMFLCNKTLTIISFFCQNLEKRFQQAQFISKQFGVAIFFSNLNLEGIITNHIQIYRVDILGMWDIILEACCLSWFSFQISSFFVVTNIFL